MLNIIYLILFGCIHLLLHLNCMMKWKLWFLLIVTVTHLSSSSKTHPKGIKVLQTSKRLTTINSFTRRICLSADSTIRAKKKVCFLRPDTGPCRADVIQYYYDVKKSQCFRFFWGGCQGNGNRFETLQECVDFCYLNATDLKKDIPHYCSLTFDYGNCFGYYYRWYWDNYVKSCKRRLYSGCGGNQNNFETREECYANCLTPPQDTYHQFIKHHRTTCLPYNPGMQDNEIKGPS